MVTFTLNLLLTSINNKLHHSKYILIIFILTNIFYSGFIFITIYWMDQYKSNEILNKYQNIIMIIMIIISICIYFILWLLFSKLFGIDIINIFYNYPSSNRYQTQYKTDFTITLIKQSVSV